MISSATIRILDRRDQKDEMLRHVEATDDAYAARRDLFLKRQRERVETLHAMGQPGEEPHRCRRKSAPAPAEVPQPSSL